MSEEKNKTRVLVVEDSRTQGQELKLILESEGFEVELASDGEKGLERLRATPFDLVLSDILMPGLTGYQLCRTVKDDPATRQIPVVLLTVLSDVTDILQGLECGADNYIIKPFEAERLIERVQHILANKNLRAGQKVSPGVEVMFKRKSFTVRSEKEQVLDFLLSAFEDFMVAKDREYESKLAEARQSFKAETYRAREAALEKEKTDLQQFVFIASHDLQEPLRMVVSYTELLARRYQGRLDKDADEFINYAVEGARRMKELINDLLAFSRVKTQAREFSKVDVSALMEQVIFRRQAALEKSGGQVSRDPLPTVLAEPNQLGQLFGHLIDNALKFQGADPPRIHISAREEDGQWVFSVRDNGLGIDPKDSERVFEMFKRLHPPGKYPGTGAGLAICSRIVENHGGRIWVESQLGKGATFLFTIPVQPEG